MTEEQSRLAAVGLVCSVVGLVGGIGMSVLVDRSEDTVAAYRDANADAAAQVATLTDSTQRADRKISELTAAASSSTQRQRADDLQAEVERLQAELADARDAIALGQNATELAKSRERELAAQVDRLRPHGRNEPTFDFGKVMIKDNGDIVGHVTNRIRSSYSGASFRLALYGAGDDLLDVVTFSVGKLPPNVAVPFKARTTTPASSVDHYDLTVDSTN